MQDVKFENLKPRVKTAQQIIDATFERQKNTKALLYTLAFLVLLLLVFFFKKFEIPKPDPPIVDALVEVSIDDNINLGNDANGGLGNIQPLVKGDFSPPDAGNPAPQQPQASNEDPTPPADPSVNEKPDEDAPELEKPTVKPVNPGKIPKPTTNPTPVRNVPINNAPPAPKPKVGGPWQRPNGTDRGNNPSTDNGFKNQGGGGGGDQGNPFGTPNGTGQRLSNANLRNSGEISRLTSQSGTNYKGKVTLVLRVDDNGSVSSIISNSPAPASREAKSFASEIAYKMKFPSGADGRTAKIILDFDF